MADERPQRAAPIRVLLTNDDGVEAPGLRALERALAEHGGVEVWTVAPDRERSACSHGMTLRRPLARKEVAPRRYAVDGLPADCVYLALFGLFARRPDVVISGINRGPNLGADVIYSGTVAGAREAALHGVHGVAASLLEGERFERAAASVAQIALNLARHPRPALLLNLNYPEGRFKGPAPAHLGVRHYPEQVAQHQAESGGAPSFWLGGGAPIHDGESPGSDGDLLSRRTASATLLRLDQTDVEALARADEALSFLRG